MRIRKDSWSDDEIDTLKAHYFEHGPAWSGWEHLLPKRSKSAIQTRARKLGLQAPNGYTLDQRQTKPKSSKRRPSVCGECIFYAKRFRYESSECGSGICTERHSRREFSGPPVVLERYKAGDLCPYGVAVEK